MLFELKQKKIVKGRFITERVKDERNRRHTEYRKIYVPHSKQLSKRQIDKLCHPSQAASAYLSTGTESAQINGIEILDTYDDPRWNALWCAILNMCRERGEYAYDAGKYWGLIDQELMAGTALGDSFENVIAPYVEKTSDLRATMKIEGQTHTNYDLLRNKMDEKALEVLPTLVELCENHFKAEEQEAERLKNEADEKTLIEKERADSETEFKRKEHVRIADIRTRAALELCDSTP